MNRGSTLWLLVSAATMGGCAMFSMERDMNSLASALTKVSAAVDVTARYRRSADALDDAQLLQAATAHDPELLQPFKSQRIRVLRDDTNSSVLVCDVRTGRALLEDAGCTAELDAHRWRDTPQGTCDFSLNLKSVCKR